MNENIRQALKILKETNTSENVDKLMDELKKSNVFVPASLPQNTDPALIKRIAQNKQEDQPIPANVHPSPAILQSKDGKNYLPVFTDKDEIHKGQAMMQAPLILGMPFHSALELFEQEAKLDAIVINAFTENVLIHSKKKQGTEQKQVQITQAQYHGIVRHQVEAIDFPKALFAQTKELLEQINKDTGSCLIQFFEQAYQNEIACPYTEADFDSMILNIRDDLTVIRIGMPEKNLVINMCKTILLLWNPQSEELRYFALVANQDITTCQNYEIKADGTSVLIGNGPTEGNELQYAIDLMDNTTKN